MKKFDKKTATLLLGLCSAKASFTTPLKDLYKAFMLGELRVCDAETGRLLDPADYKDCGFESAVFGSREKMAEHFNSITPRKTLDQVSSTCKICRLLRRANQLKNELSEIDRQLNETYGIVLSSESLLLHNERSSFRTHHQGNSKKCCSCSRHGRFSSVQENFSPSSRDVSEPFDYQRILDQL